MICCCFVRRPSSLLRFVGEPRLPVLEVETGTGFRLAKTPAALLLLLLVTTVLPDSSVSSTFRPRLCFPIGPENREVALGGLYSLLVVVETDAAGEGSSAAGLIRGRLSLSSTVGSTLGKVGDSIWSSEGLLRLVLWGSLRALGRMDSVVPELLVSTADCFF